MVHKIHAIVVVVLALGALAAGCSSDKQPSRSQKMVEGFAKTKAAVLDAQQQVAATVAAMDVVGFTGASAGRGGVNLNDAFQHYKEMVTALEKTGADAKRRSQAMREDSETNIMAWQEEMETIKDPSIKASVQSRREAVRTNFKLIRMYADDARKAYEPFLQQNKDIVAALSIDLSPAALTGLEPAMARTRASGDALKQKLNALERALGNIENGISPLGDATPP